ncbi:MAG TPA: TlpA disulfide reductase family protein [Gammaproteobacteria bacterium]|nr:TlpA disulfide reductase family protein [Gammaproteobacteria bacterium]
MMAAAPRLLLCGLLLLSVGGTLHAGQNLTPVPGAIPAPDFELRDTDGRLHRLSDYRGKTVIINFWATWCPPCREEIPSMNRAWQQLREVDVAMLAVNMGEDEDTIFVFTADYPAEFPLLLDRDGAVTAQWPVKGLPTTYIVAPDGTIAYRAIGGRDWDDSEILETLRALR